MTGTCPVQQKMKSKHDNDFILDTKCMRLWMSYTCSQAQSQWAQTTFSSGQEQRSVSCCMLRKPNFPVKLDLCKILLLRLRILSEDLKLLLGAENLSQEETGSEELYAVAAVICCWLMLFMEKKKLKKKIQRCIFKTFCDTANIHMELEMLLDTFLPPP